VQRLDKPPPLGLAPGGGTQKVYICVEYEKIQPFEPRAKIHNGSTSQKQGKSYSFIAETIGVATSTVSREIRRNQTPRGRYSCRQAETYASERKEWRYYPRKFTPKMRHDVEQIIRQQQWSPEQIVGRFRLEGIPIVGKTTLYTFLHKNKERGGDLYRHTRHHLKYRHKPLASPQKGKWGRRKSIDERPDCIDRKERFGDFEMDLIIGAQQREAILTLTERKTGYAIIEKLPNGKNARSLARVVNRSLAYFKRMGLLHSITTDNGSEFMAF